MFLFMREGRIFVGDVLLDQLHDWDKVRKAFKCKIFFSCLRIPDLMKNALLLKVGLPIATMQ